MQLLCQNAILKKFSECKLFTVRKILSEFSDDFCKPVISTASGLVIIYNF